MARDSISITAREVAEIAANLTLVRERLELAIETLERATQIPFRELVGKQVSDSVRQARASNPTPPSDGDEK